jgi:hypothetical protein
VLVEDPTKPLAREEVVMGRFQPFERGGTSEGREPTPDQVRAELGRFQEVLRAARLDQGPSSLAGIWHIVEPWYERALNQERVIGLVHWSPQPVASDEIWFAYGDLSAFTEAAEDRRGLEGDLGQDPYIGYSPESFTPMHLRVEKRGNEKATAQVTLTRTGETRLLDYPYELLSENDNAARFAQQEDVEPNWTYVMLTDSINPYAYIIGAFSGVFFRKQQ